MICSRKVLLSLLLLASTACLASQQPEVDGYIEIQPKLVRQTSNANVQLNAQNSRTTSVKTIGNYVTFMNEIHSISKDTHPAVTFIRVTAYVATSPFPTVLVTKTTASGGGNFNFNTMSSAATFPVAVEYNETNGQTGFQAGNDTVAQTFDLKENLATWTTTSTPTNWNTLTVSTEMYPMATDSTKNATVNVATSCNTVNGFCFTFRFSNAMYVRNGVTYLPDAVKVDMLAPTSKFISTNGMLALLSNMLSTNDSYNMTNMHTAVDSTMAQAKSSGGTAVVSPDFIISYTTNNTDSAYLNFARTATLASAANGNSTVTVMSAVVNETQVQNLINVSYATQVGQIDTNFQDLTRVEAIVYSFLAANNNASSITWDPEIGVAAVNTSNMVVGGTVAGLSAGAIAGIVIAVVVVVGVAGFFGYRAVKNRQAKKDGSLLGN